MLDPNKKTKWPAWNRVLPVFLKREFWEYKKMLYQKYKEGYDFWAISGHVFSNHRFYQPKQTQLPVASYSSSSIFGRNEYCRAQWQKHQVLFNKAPPHLRPRKHSGFTKILCSFNSHFKWRWKLWLNSEFVLQVDLYQNCLFEWWEKIILQDSDEVLSNVELRG